MEFDQTWIQVDLDAIEHNFCLVCQKTGAGVLATVKADAYGMGAVAVAQALEDRCAFLGTANIAEALELRWAGIRKPILILGRIPVSAYPDAIANDIRMPIFVWEDAQALSQEAQRQGKTARFHFAVDTGMGRIGFEPGEASADLCTEIVKLPNLRAEGLFSHFATADCADLTRTRLQARRFEDFDAMLKARGIHIPIRHLNNSAGIMNLSESYEMVRSGIVTYGLYPSREVDPTVLPIRPVLRWLTRVAYVKTLPAGRQISYGGDYTTSRRTRVATLPVGYADGYRRGLTGRGWVLLHGKKAPIIGRICMDQMMVDVTDIPDVAIGDTATLIGCDGPEEITADTLADLTDTISYEIICGISRRIPRLYFRGDHPVSEVHHLLDSKEAVL